MREKLKNIEGSREEFSGIFVRFGFKNGFKGIVKTVLFKDIKNNKNEIVADHLWFNLTKGFDNLKLIENDVIRFTARTKKYIKGYFGRREDIYVPMEEDYKLSHPTKMEKQ